MCTEPGTATADESSVSLKAVTIKTLFGEATVVHAPFESACFGFPVAKVQSCTCCSPDNGELGTLVVQELVSASYRHASARIPASRAYAVQSLEHAGFYFVDTHVSLIARIPPSAVARPTGSKLLLRRATLDDLPEIQCLGSTLFPLSRFFTDQALPRAEAAEVLRIWIENDVRGRADAVLIVRGEVGQLVGYVACLCQADGSTEIDLIGVDASARGRGVGRFLVEGVFQLYSEKTATVRVTTQGGNSAALRLYQSCGFQVESVDVTLHALVANGGASDGGARLL